MAEDPWRLERLVDFTDPNYQALTGSTASPRIAADIAPGFYFSPQIAFESRIHPPLDPAPNAALLGAAAFALRENLWNQQLSSRRFSWAVLHRLQKRVGPRLPNVPAALTPQQSSALVAEAAAAMGSARTLDVYRVTLRRSNASKRYARQDPNPNALPDPYNRAAPAVSPLGLPSVDDVAFPVAWRVQVQLVKPGDTLNSTALDTLTGVPTEIHVPPVGIAEPTATMLVSMFPTGARFVDEITGQIYRVVKRRVTIDDSGNQSGFLTLDREISFEDVEDKSLGLPPPTLPQIQARPLEHEENVRTVWVYPPPVDRSAGGSATVFEGKSPVVNIDVRTISLSPSG
ncbi:MAG: hypothetical protein IIB59_06955 [Planctomycetes bacterium]|nr:hypothetical protein [Planctomycetota bacterium]